mmetsp:Transcript_25003/g.73144  ORF Transcript_25003/g.73144 Transcript_25003/m.73144 type:complete len:245 (-) Transcript_25003:1976-2710(-)
MLEFRPEEYVERAVFLGGPRAGGDVSLAEKDDGSDGSVVVVGIVVVVFDGGGGGCHDRQDGQSHVLQGRGDAVHHGIERFEGYGGILGVDDQGDALALFLFQVGFGGIIVPRERAALVQRHVALLVIVKHAESFVDRIVETQQSSLYAVIPRYKVEEIGFVGTERHGLIAYPRYVRQIDAGGIFEYARHFFQIPPFVLYHDARGLEQQGQRLHHIQMGRYRKGRDRLGQIDQYQIEGSEVVARQ